MKHIFLSLYLFLSLLICAVPAMAAEPVPAAEPVADGSADTIKTEDVDRLIKTLENDQTRAQFLNDLKLLTAQQQKEEQAPEPLTEAIGVRQSVSQAVSEYDRFLEKNNLSSSLVHRSIVTAIVLLVAVAFFFGVRKMSRKIIRQIGKLSQRIGVTLSRFNAYTNILQFVLRVLVGGLAVYTIGKVWEIGFIDRIFESGQMRQFLSTSFTVLLVAFFAALIWEAVGIYLSYVFKQADDHNQTRVKTVLPILRNVILVVVAVLFGLVLMSEIGINVTPLLAGAGVIGVAVGFGAQTMVKDFLSGLTIILEDLVRVGDVASLGGHTGLVEKITLRKIQLRDFGGIVYTVPFSEITTIQNLTKDFSYYVMDVGVSYNADTDHVVEVMKQVDEGLRADETFGPLILDPLEVVGVDRFLDSAVVIKARIKTLPIKQWAVGREFNRRMKQAFDKAGIEIPFPQRTVTVVNAPAAVLGAAAIE